MEGLIPLLIRAMKKQKPQHAYRCLSENSTGRSYHLLLAADGSSHRRTPSDFHRPDAVDCSTVSENSAAVGPAAAITPSNSNAEIGLKQRGFSAAAHYGQVSTRT